MYRRETAQVRSRITTQRLRKGKSFVGWILGP
jgi:hypothetical protein